MSWQIRLQACLFKAFTRHPFVSARHPLPSARRKKLLDVEAKLKLALAERQAAVADKATIERQLKQVGHRKMWMGAAGQKDCGRKFGAL
jgi:hypothetical protein